MENTTAINTTTTATNTTTVSHACPDCGMVVGRWDEEYASQYPNGFDMAVEQAMARHHSGECPNSSEWDTVVTCPHCGEEIGSWDYEYTSRNPNGFDMAVSQAREQHNQCCPVLVEQAWGAWREKAKAREEETPRQLLARRFAEGMRMALYKIPCPPDRENEYYDQWLDEIQAFIKEKMRV